MKHERGTGGAAPASNVAGRGDAQGTPLPVRPTTSDRVMPCGSLEFLADSCRCGSDSGWIGPTRADAAPTRAESGRLGPYRQISTETAKMAEIKKKKKNAQNAPFKEKY